MKPLSKNTRLLLLLLLFGCFMVGMAYTFVPLYRLFCQALGIPVASVVVGVAATPKPLAETPLDGREITVRFVGNVADGLPIEFTPMQRKISLKLSQPALVAYQAKNNSNQTITGVAVHTIVAQSSTGGDEDVSAYVDLQQCFCFEEQIYPAGQQVQLPLSFHLSNTLPAGVHTVIFGYTLYRQP